ncbi:helicase, partial [Ceratobasidium sp. 370]
RNPQTKKHKTWDGDGILVITGSRYELLDEDAKAIGNGKILGDLSEGSEIKLGNRELQIEREVPSSEFLSGKVFAGGGPPGTTATKTATPGSLTIRATGFVPPKLTRPPLKTPGTTPDTKGKSVDRGEIADNPKPSAIVGRYWTANWRRPQARKHKNWEGSGAISLVDGQLKLVNEEGHPIGTKAWKGDPPDFGDVIIIGGHEAEIDAPLSSVEYTASFKPPTVHIVSVNGGDESMDGEVDLNVEIAYDVSPVKHRATSAHNHTTSALPRASLPTKPLLKTTGYAFKPPAMRRKRQTKKHKSWEGFGIVELTNGSMKLYNDKGRLHDPNGDGALVLTAPDDAHQCRHNTKKLPVVSVVVDPLLAKFLRPHQREGVQFMYESVMGMRTRDQHGCILADEMGLGKTLQTIALIWTLLRQNPYYNPNTSSQGVIGKALIVCPVSLVNNWRKEFFKWLGRDRIRVFVGDKDKANIKQFMNSKLHHVLIIGYEKLRTVIDDLTYCTYACLNSVVLKHTHVFHKTSDRADCHRLKSAQAKTTKMFEALKRTPRRIILSGTPIQNDLGEFHAMADFCNPGNLEEYSRFRRIYETPILKSRSPEASAKDVELGAARASQLNEIAKSFVLRRTADILTNYLPPKTEYVVFVQPTALQLGVFQKILRPDHVQDLVHGPTARSLALITTLTKICNSPIMLAKPSAEVCITLTYVWMAVTKRQQLVDEFNRVSQSQKFLFLLSAKAGGVGLNLIGASRLVLIDSDWNPSHDLQSMARIHRDGQKRPVFIYRLITAGTIDEKIYQRQVTKLGLSNSLISEAAVTDKAGSSKSSGADSFTRRDCQCSNTDHIIASSANSDDEEELVSAADLIKNSSKAAAGKKPAKRIESDSESESDVEMGFIAASQVRPDKISKAEKRRKREALAALSDWRHINCLADGFAELVQDPILLHLLQNTSEAEGSSLLNSKKSQVESGSTDGGDWGGIVSYVFEKRSGSQLA